MTYNKALKKLATRKYDFIKLQDDTCYNFIFPSVSKDGIFHETRAYSKEEYAGINWICGNWPMKLGYKEKQFY